MKSQFAIKKFTSYNLLVSIFCCKTFFKTIQNLLQPGPNRRKSAFVSVIIQHFCLKALIIKVTYFTVWKLLYKWFSSKLWVPGVKRGKKSICG